MNGLLLFKFVRGNYTYMINIPNLGVTGQRVNRERPLLDLHVLSLCCFSSIDRKTILLNYLQNVKKL